MRAAAALGLAAALTLTACTDNKTKPTAAKGPTGGTLRVGITEPGAVDPANAYEPSGTLVNSLLCEPLLHLDAETGELKPGLATTWIVSNGGRRITLRLRKAKFSDGSQVTSDDVVASLSRAASEEFAGNTIGLLEPIDGWREISGAAESKVERDLRILRGVSSIDSLSLTINLAHRDADFLRVLAHPIAAPMPRSLIEGDDADALSSQPVCAGPYKLAQQWTPGDPVIRLVRNDHYHGRTPSHSNGGKGYADSVEFHVGASPFALWQEGRVDVAALPADAAGGVAPQDKAQRGSGHIEFVGLPTSGNSPFADPSVRVAMSRALDRSAISPNREPARGFLPPAAGPSGRTDGCGDRAPERPVRDETIDLSAIQLELSYNDEFANRSMAQTVADQWHAAFGMTVTLKPTPFDELASAANKPEGLKTAYRFGWLPQMPRPDAYLTPLFTSAGIGSSNIARFADPAVERALDRDARNAADEEERDLAYRAVEDRLCDLMPLIPVVAGVSRFAIRSSAVGSAVGSTGEPTLDRTRGWPVLRELFVRTRGEA